MPLNLKSTITRKHSTPPPTKAANSQRDAATPEPRPRIPPVRSQTSDVLPSAITRKPSQNSIYSTVSKADKKRSAWRGVAKSIPGLLKSSRTGSSTSLASQDLEPRTETPPPVPELPPSASGFQSKIPVKRSTLSPKASTLGQDPSIIKNGIRAQEASAHEDDGRPSTESSETMVEDYQTTIRSLTEELSTTHQQLIEITNERSALRDHMRALENTHEEQLRQRVEQAASHTRDELTRAHASELENRQTLIQSLEKRNEDLASRITSMENETAESTRTGAAEAESTVQNLQRSLESLQNESLLKDEKLKALAGDNEQLRQWTSKLEESNRILTKGGEEKLRAIAEMKQVKRQLQDAEIFLKGRDEQISALESAREDSDNALHSARTQLDEKEMVIGDLKRRGAAFEAENKLLGERISDSERQFQELRNSSQRTLQSTIDDYERRIIDAANTIQALKDGSSSSSTATLQLQSSLESARADAAEATKAAAASQDELVRLREQCTVLEGTIQDLEEQNKASQAEKAELARVRTAEVEAERRAIHNLRRSIESSERDHAAKEERTSLLLKSNEELRRDIMSLKEQREREEREAGSMRKDLEAANATLYALEEKSRLALQEATKESNKLADEVDQLRRQLKDVQSQLAQHEAQPPAQGVDDTWKVEFGKANATIIEQKAVIARLQQSIGEKSREDRQPPQLIVNVAKATLAEPQRRRTVSTASRIELTNRHTKRPTSLEALAQATQATTSATPTPSKPQNTTPPPRQASPVPPPHETTEVLKDDGKTPQADSPSEGYYHVAPQPQIKDVKRFKQQTQPTMAYKMGHAVFGSLWRRIWG